MSGYVAGASALLSTIGAATSAYANNQAMRKQDRIAADSIQRQGQLSNQANAVVQQTVQKNATNEQANLQANQQKQQAAYLDALRRAAPTQNAATPGLVGGSKAYAEAAKAAQASNADFGRTQAGLLSRTDAPQLTALQTAQGLGNAATQIGLIQDQSSREAALAKLREQAITANPWILAAGSLASGAGQGLAAGAGRGAPKYAQVGNGTGIMADNGLGSLAGTVA